MTNEPKSAIVIHLEHKGYGVINNTGYLDVIKDDERHTIILDGTEEYQMDHIVNLDIFKKREKAYNKIEGIRVGDYVRLNTGKLTRVTHIWDLDEKLIQTGGGEYGQFYIGYGYISYSGGLDPGIDESEFKLTEEQKEGQVWFFKDDHWGAGRGIDYMMKFRIFEQMP